MKTQLFVASTAFGLASLVAALDDGAFEPADRRLLVLSINASVPEAAIAIDEVAGVGALIQRFSAVHDYNAAVAPQHPSTWKPRTVDLPLLERYLTQRLELVGDLHLIVESVWTAPSLTLCRIFADARIDTYADGLMSYGPTRTAVPTLVAVRIERLLHLDLVPGLTPVLLSEHGVATRVISTEAFRRVVAGLGAPPSEIAHGRPSSVAVLLGQYLGALGILTCDEEEALYLAMVRGAVAAGFKTLVFKPHVGAPPVLAQPLSDAARALGADLAVVDDPAIVESWFGAPALGVVIGCFSTALMTAASCYQLRTARVGTEMVMERLKPFENSNRIPLTIVDARVADLGSPAEANLPPGLDLDALVQAVSYCMQPERYPGLRSSAEAVLAAHGPALRRYFRRRLLTKLDLPGRMPPPTPSLVTRRRPAPGRVSRRQVSRVLSRLRQAAASRWR